MPGNIQNIQNNVMINTTGGYLFVGIREFTDDRDVKY